MKKRTPLAPRVAVAALSSPLEVGADRAPRAAGDLARRLRKAGCEVVDLGAIGTPATAVAAGRRLAEAHVDAAALAVASWFEDYLILDLLEECRVPLLFWPLPGMETGALCGTQQLTCYLKQLDTPCASVFGKIGDAACLGDAMAFLHGAALHSRLRRCRIGLAGNRINGMTHTSPNEFVLKKSIGPRVVMLDLPTLLQRAREMPEASARALWRGMKKRAGTCEVSDTDGIDSLRVYAAVRELVDKHGLHALTIGCYPHLMGKVCLAASRLADESIPLACEGDVHGAVGQYMLQLLTGQPTHNTDWLDPVDGDSVVFTHCGSGSFTLAEKPSDIRLASVRLMGQGACALFTAKPGPVTLVNINACGDAYQCALLEGEAVPTEMVFPGNPVRVRFATPVKSLTAWVHDAGLGHHWMIGYGHVGAAVRAWSSIAGPGLRLLAPPW
ncbi:MAG: hypothetical protein A3K19_06825 [Lentisphaerae bacterium RIFOXYB12_FULL_65_16]|nr:MAG: hypothetical protein A3K18_21945 [Lentisphaerae bacterium RIFOXYA12_64_32]OGV93163.1 MAG: hypothetical protein A3K19_06825 [Lentisphaerae bacterium RIFOXYB12_FULL_65_16]